jgi:hypothetical protein
MKIAIDIRRMTELAWARISVMSFELWDGSPGTGLTCMHGFNVL